MGSELGELPREDKYKRIPVNHACTHKEDNTSETDRYVETGKTKEQTTTAHLSNH
jgi:hypothetical protein